jgi:hypothetical protein
VLSGQDERCSIQQSELSPIRISDMSTIPMTNIQQTAATMPPRYTVFWRIPDFGQQDRASY